MNAYVDLVDALAVLHPGDHLCCLYSTEAEHRAVLSAFVQQGLVRGEKVVYILDYHTRDEIIDYVRGGEIDVDDCLARGQLQFLDTAEAYLSDGHFEPERMIDVLRQATQQAQLEGYPALRATGEMSWSLRGLPGSDRLNEYEAVLNRFFQQYACLAICQYDQRRFSAEALLRVLETHPRAIVGLEVYDNFYYAPPDEFLQPNRSRAQLARWLRQLAERRQLDRQLSEHRQRLEQQVAARTRELEDANRQLQHQIIERERIEGARHESEERYRLLVEQSSDGVALIDEQGQIVEWNRALEDIVGISRSDVLGHSLWEVQLSLFPTALQTSDRQLQMEMSLRQALQTGAAPWLGHSVTQKIHRRDGRRVVVEMLFYAIDTPTGHLLGSIMRDVTEHQRTEAALRESEERYRALIDSLPAAIVVMQDGRVNFANDAARRMSGYADTRDMVGRSILDFLDRVSHATALERLQRLQDGHPTPPIEMMMRRLDGTPYYAEIRSVPITLDGRAAALVVGQDITERKRMADAERDQRTLAEALRDTANALTSTLNLDEVLDRILLNIGRVIPHDAASIMLLDADQDMAYVARYHGYLEPRLEEEAIGLRLSVSLASNLQTMRGTSRPLVIGDVQTYPGWVIKQGREWIRSFAGVPLLIQNQLVGFLNLYSRTSDFYSAVHLERLQAFADQVANAIQNAQLHARIQTHADDLEMRVMERTRELTAANVRLTELDRLKDQFISRISHELRTPLSSIKIYLDLLENGKPEKHAKYLQTLNEQTDRLQELIESLLDVSRLDLSEIELHLEKVDLNRVAQHLAESNQPSVRQRRKSLTAALAPGKLPIKTDSLLLAQVLSNILANAVQYTPEGGAITLVTAEQLADNRGWATLTVRDTGPGISAADRPYIFDRFYRGEAARDYKTPGAGVGLAVSHEIITKLGGRLTLDSQPGEGAAFTLWLPIALGD